MIRAALAAALLVGPALAAATPVAPVLTPAEAGAAFREANDLCLKEDFERCIDGYQRLIAAGYGSADVEYNLGTAYLKQAKIGFAVLHLERALRLDPSDGDSRANLESARRQRVDRIVGGNAPEEAGGEEPLSTRIVSHTSADRWALAFLAVWIAGVLALALRRLARSETARRAALLAGLFLVAASVPCGGVVLTHLYVRERTHEAVIVAASLPVREGPQESSKAAFEVHEGLKVRVLDQEGAFRRIQLSNGLQGWVSASGTVEIAPER